jgi:hypothetical protein
MMRIQNSTVPLQLAADDIPQIGLVLNVTGVFGDGRAVIQSEAVLI